MNFLNAPQPPGDPPGVMRPPTLVLPGAEPPRPNGLLKSPPLIREQGPSAPSSPTSPGRGKRLCPNLTEDAMHRINLMNPGGFSQSFGKLSPMTSSGPGWQYATSDLGSSPRSSISVTSASLGPWTAFREHHKSSFDLDDGASDCGKDLLSPGMMLSPAPFSPFSDCDGTETPYSSYARSPNLSPNPSSARSLNHFSFDQIRSSSSMSSRGDAHLLAPSASLDEQSRERSRSDSDMSPKEESMDTSVHSTISVPASTSRRLSSTGQYKKRLLQKYQEEQQSHRSSAHRGHAHSRGSANRSSSSPPPSATESELDELEHRSVSRVPTVEETDPTPPPMEVSGLSAALPPSSVGRWMEAQVMLMQSAFINQQQQQHQLTSSQLLAPPPFQLLPRTLAKQNTVDESCGPIKGATLWRRSRSETDVSRQQPISQNYPNGEHTCQLCGAGFTCHDRLAKHIASRHRARPQDAALEEDARVHKCTLCTKKFTRSDMLTRHMRLHTGAKPYSCRLCGQVFSRSDHLSTHQRTHSGEKPYQCSKCNYTASRRDMITRHYRTHDSKDVPDIPIAQLSLSPLPPSNSLSLSPLPSSNSLSLSPLPTNSLLTPSALSPSTLSPSATLSPSLSCSTLSSSHTLSPSLSSFPLLPQMDGVRAMLSAMGGSLEVPSTSLGSGERSAFLPPSASSSSRLLAPPTLSNSLSVPSSPAFSRQSTLSPSLSRQASVGGFESTDQPPSS